MCTDTDPIELPDFVADGFLKGCDSEQIDTTEIVAEDPTWQGPAAPSERIVTLSFAAGTDGAVVIERNQSKPTPDKLLFSSKEPAMKRYQTLIEETAKAETGMVSAAGRVTIQRSSAAYVSQDYELSLPDEVMHRGEITADRPPCNRCHEPVATDDQRTIGDILFWRECHDEVCGRCGAEIPDTDSQDVTDGVGAGTTCPSCTAEHVDWLCSNCETEIQDDENQILIDEDQFRGTYCRDFAPAIREQLEEATDPSQSNTDQESAF